MWYFNNSQFTEDQIGNSVAFVYLIRNLKTGKSYIGKKLFTFTRSKTIKGKKKRVKKASGWESYWGSNKTLQEDVISLGEDNFRREILHLCPTKGTANYLELREQIDRRVLETDAWYNDQIYVRVHRTHIRHTEKAVD